LGFHYEFREIERPSGTSSILYLASQTPDPNKVLCFLHGFGDDLFFPGSRLFLHLLQSGWDILTCDLDGHGKGGTAKFDKNRSLSNLEPLLSFFENKYPGRPKLHLCGFSFGAATMLKYAVHNPEHIASLTLLGMPLWSSAEDLCSHRIFRLLF